MNNWKEIREKWEGEEPEETFVLRFVAKGFFRSPYYFQGSFSEAIFEAHKINYALQWGFGVTEGAATVEIWDPERNIEIYRAEEPESLETIWSVVAVHLSEDFNE